ncbi:Dymeclin [Polychytrium aggregatum]|uniref:Dymeclin n=1 Tax=Polychytrium aggregatum TaxID=110093 RepID=UPI0022FE87D9|nr:Dymeclin [Polychytrium aggregatum]KAI9209840.1 Dymeclin [Polychytrium aggregatum]
MASAAAGSSIAIAGQSSPDIRPISGGPLADEPISQPEASHDSQFQHQHQRQQHQGSAPLPHLPSKRASTHSILSSRDGQSSVPHSPSASRRGSIPGDSLSNSSSPAVLDSPRRQPTLTPSLVVKSPSENKYLSHPQFQSLKEFSSKTRFSHDNLVLWQKLLSEKLPAPLNSQEAFDLDMASRAVGEALLNNNASTANFNVLLLHLLSQLRFMRNIAYDGLWSPEAYNAMFLVRVCTKYFTENLTRAQLHEQFEMNRVTAESPKESVSPSTPTQRLSIDQRVTMDKRLRAEQLLEELFHVIIYADTKQQQNYEFYIEALNLLIVLFSTQMKGSSVEAGNDNYFLDILMNHLSHFAKGSLVRLISNFEEQQPPPNPSVGVLYSAYSYLFIPKKLDSTRSSPLSDKSVLLILLLANQHPRHIPNEFRLAVACLEDMPVGASRGPALSSDIDPDNLSVPYSQIYQTICSTLSTEETTLLLYLLMLQNKSFKTYALSRTDPESLLIPLLKQVYESVENKANYSHMYILLIILLLISQDEEYTANLHKTMIPVQGWYTERILKQTSLGGYVILVLIRTIQLNLSHHKDVYFHTNCLAILANMSNRMSYLNATVAQRVISLFDLVAKRYLKIYSKFSAVMTIDEIENCGDNDFVVYGDLVALLLEIINSVMTHTLKQNPHLVYSILHRREMFAKFRMHSRFVDLIENIDCVIGYFLNKVTESEIKMPSVDEVLEVIDIASKTWMPTKLRIFAELKFQYEEEKEFALFFLPYIWSLVFKHSLIHWDIEKTKLVQELGACVPIHDFSTPF